MKSSKISKVVKKKKTERKPAIKKNAAQKARHAALLRAIKFARANTVVRKPAPELRRHDDNPILSPRADRYWEMKATFNPGAMYADNRVHLLYRAIGGDDISVLGYASSNDGITIDERSEEPAFVPVSTKYSKGALRAELPKNPYISGGGWNGGCEDPRLTLIEETVYLTYTAFDGWGSIRLALSSLGLDDFLNKRWRWKKASLISPPGEIHKNWVLFPEKINGKFAILHSISPDISIDYVDSLDEFDDEERVIKSRYDRTIRQGAWDSWIRGAGPPPIRTKLGWLLFYHAMDIQDPNRYKLGAMILDINDPKKIVYRSQAPILEPDAHYENQGYKSGVVYSCGAVVKDGMLYVYYGGSDSVTCVAMASMDKFLEDLKKHGTPKLAPEIKRRATHARA